MYIVQGAERAAEPSLTTNGCVALGQTGAWVRQEPGSDRSLGQTGAASTLPAVHPLVPWGEEAPIIYNLVLLLSRERAGTRRTDPSQAACRNPTLCPLFFCARGDPGREGSWHTWFGTASQQCQTRYTPRPDSRGDLYRAFALNPKPNSLNKKNKP